MSIPENKEVIANLGRSVSAWKSSSPSVGRSSYANKISIQKLSEKRNYPHIYRGITVWNRPNFHLLDMLP